MAYAATRRGIMSRNWTPNDIATSLSLWLTAADPNTLIINQASTSDSTGPQNSAGGQGIAINGTASGSLQNVTTYTDVGGTPSGHISINATAGVTNVTGVSTVQSGALHIGGAFWSGANANYYLGGISQVIMVNGDASTATTAKVEGYLAWSSGLQSLLPATNQYKPPRPRSVDRGTILRPEPLSIERTPFLTNALKGNVKCQTRRFFQTPYALHTSRQFTTTRHTSLTNHVGFRDRWAQ